MYSGPRSQGGEAGAQIDAPAQGGLLVDDEAASLLPGQMRKTDFLQALRPAVCTAADRELARAGRNTDGCPYLDRWFGYYGGRDARQVERSLRKYAPETAGATSASDYLRPISERVAQGVHRWVDTGDVPELPEGVSADMLGGGGVVYRPGQPVGDALLAHELAHVVQQGGAHPAMPVQAPAENDAVEQDADVAAVAAVLSLWTPPGSPGGAEREAAVPRLRSGLQLRRCGPQQKAPETAATAARTVPATKGACPPVVVNPTWEVAAQPITAGKDRCDLRLAKTLVKPDSGFGLNGMEFKGTLTMPAACPGKVYFVQYVKPSRKNVGCFDSKEEGFCVTPGIGLDTAWPYPVGSVVNTDQDPGTSVPFSTVDSPGQKNISRSDLGLVRICMEDSFTTYIVFEDKTGALTSLGWMSWSYTAHAVRDGGKCPPTTTTPDCAGWTVTGTGSKGGSDFTVGASAPQQALDRSVGAVSLMPSDCAPDGCPK